MNAPENYFTVRADETDLQAALRWRDIATQLAWQLIHSDNPEGDLTLAQSLTIDLGGLPR